MGRTRSAPGVAPTARRWPARTARLALECRPARPGPPAGPAGPPGTRGCRARTKIFVTLDSAPHAPRCSIIASTIARVSESKSEKCDTEPNGKNLWASSSRTGTGGTAGDGDRHLVQLRGVCELVQVNHVTAGTLARGLPHQQTTTDTVIRLHLARVTSLRHEPENRARGL
jgi:hypothetical protein